MRRAALEGVEATPAPRDVGRVGGAALRARRWARAWACLGLAWAWLGGAASAGAVELLNGAQAMETLCAYGAPAPEPLEPPLKAKAKRDHAPAPAYGPARQRDRARLKAQHERLLKLYAVDVNPQHFKVADYDATTGLLTLVAQRTFTLWDGAYAVELRDSPLLVYAVSQDEADRIALAHGADRVALRLVFALSALDTPGGAWCKAPKGGGPTALQAVLVGSQLVTHEGDGAEVVLAEQQLKERAPYAEAVGATMQGDEGKRPRVYVGRVRAVDGELPERERDAFARDVEVLALPCYVRLLCLEGARRGVLVLEAHTDDEGGMRAVDVSVDATGAPQLGRCVVEQLLRFKGLDAMSGRALLVNVYFDRW